MGNLIMSSGCGFLSDVDESIVTITGAAYNTKGLSFAHRSLTISFSISNCSSGFSSECIRQLQQVFRKSFMYNRMIISPSVHIDGELDGIDIYSRNTNLLNGGNIDVGDLGHLITDEESKNGVLTDIVVDVSPMNEKDFDLSSLCLILDGEDILKLFDILNRFIM